MRTDKELANLQTRSTILWRESKQNGEV